MSIGTPDWQDYAQWQGVPLLNETFSVTTAAPATSEWVLGNWASLFISITGVSTGVAAGINYYTDETYTTSVATWAYVVTDGAPLQVNIPVLTPYITLQITTTQAGTVTGTVYVSPSNTQASPPLYPVHTSAIQELNQSLALSGTVTYMFPAVVSGTCYLMLNPRDTAAKLTATVQQLNEANTPNATLQQMDAAAGSQTLPFTPVGKPFQILVTNIDSAAAHSFDLMVGLTP